MRVMPTVLPLAWVTTMHADLSPPSCPCWTSDPWLVDPNVTCSFVDGGGTSAHAQDDGNSDLSTYSRHTATKCSCDQKSVGPTSCARQPAPPHFVSIRPLERPSGPQHALTMCPYHCCRRLRTMPRIDGDQADRWTCMSERKTFPRKGDCVAPLGHWLREQGLGLN